MLTWSTASIEIGVNVSSSSTCSHVEAHIPGAVDSAVQSTCLSSTVAPSTKAKIKFLKHSSDCAVNTKIELPNSDISY